MPCIKLFLDKDLHIAILILNSFAINKKMSSLSCIIQK